MNSEIQDAIKAFRGKLIGHNIMKQMVAKAVLKLSQDIGEYVLENVWFLSNDPESFGYTFKGDDLKGKYLIFLSEDLFQEPEHQIQYTILHEIGHVILKHRNAIDYNQPKEEIDQQELQADQFANKYLS